MSPDPISARPSSFLNPDAESRRRGLLSPARVRGLVLALLIGSAGCAPAITHGPRVRPGTAAGGSVSLGVMSGSGGYPNILPSSVIFIRHGWGADSARNQHGVQIGAQISPFILWAAIENGAVDRNLLQAVEADFYVQAPKGPPRGAGIFVSRNVLMPYVQYGEDKPGGDTRYTTQGIAFSFAGNYNAIYWAPSIALREVGLQGRHAAHYQLGGALGFAQYGFAQERAPIWMVTAGLVIEFNEAEPDK